MPNWCSYGVHIAGNYKHIQELDKLFTYEENGEDKHDFTRLRPTPSELLDVPAFAIAKDDELQDKYNENKEKYGSSNWYDWNVNNWGTKWAPDVGVYEVELSLDENASNIWASGESAWSPPTNLMQYISKHFPVAITMTYDESGMGFAGAEAFFGGEIVYNGYFDYQSIPRLYLIDLEGEQIDTEDGKWDEWWQKKQDAIEQEVSEREDVCMHILKQRIKT